VIAIEAREFPDLEASVVWTVVADPSRLGAWFPLTVLAGGDREPGPGADARVSWRRRRRPESAWRVVVTEWDAGASYRCRIEGIPGLRDTRLAVRVETRPAGTGTRVVLRFEGRASGTARATLYRAEARRRLRRSLSRIGAAAGR